MVVTNPLGEGFDSLLMNPGVDFARAERDDGAPFQFSIRNRIELLLRAIGERVRGEHERRGHGK